MRIQAVTAMHQVRVCGNRRRSSIHRSINRLTLKMPDHTPTSNFALIAERFTTPNMRLLKERHGFDTVGSRQLCLELASLPDHSRVLDVGTSTGWMAIMLGAHGHQVVGIDVDGDALASATKFAYQFGPDVAERISFLPGNAIELPFEAESFDGVFSFESLHHFPNCQNALDEMLRVCRPGGVLVIADLNEKGREVVRDAIASLTGKIHEVNACRLQEVEQLTQHLGTMQRHDGPFLSIFVIKK